MPTTPPVSYLHTLCNNQCEMPQSFPTKKESNQIILESNDTASEHCAKDGILLTVAREKWNNYEHFSEFFSWLESFYFCEFGVHA